MERKKNTPQIVVQYIVGDNNTSNLNAPPSNSLANYDVIKLIKENVKLRADLNWALNQLKIKDLLLKKYAE